VEAGERAGALEIGAGNGFRAVIAPRFGLETERSEGAGSRTDLRRFLVWKTKVQARNVDLAMVAKASL